MGSLLPWLMQIQHTNEDIVRRGRIIVVLALFVNAMAIIAIPLVVITVPQTTFELIAINLIGLVVYTTVTILAQRGLVAVSGVIFVVTISLLTLMATFGSANDNATSYSSPFFLTFPIIIAWLVLKPALVWITFLFNLSGLLRAWQLTGIPLLVSPSEGALQNVAILLLSGTTLFAFVGGRTTKQALRETCRLHEEASRNACRFTALNAKLETEIAERTAALETTLRDLEQHVAAQARLLAESEQRQQVIRDLSVPNLVDARYDLGHATDWPARSGAARRSATTGAPPDCPDRRARSAARYHWRTDHRSTGCARLAAPRRLCPADGSAGHIGWNQTGSSTDLGESRY